MTSIMLSPKDIFDQEFKHSMRGYDRKEVDEFLDDIIKDYETFMAQIQVLQKENDELREQLKASTANESNASPMSTYQASEPFYGASSVVSSDLLKPSGAVTNFDILKRISRLEKEVFGKQIVE